jgi:ABC-2 type transport system permease protein
MFEVTSVADLDSARRALQRGDVSAVVRVPKGFQERLLGGEGGSVTLYKNPAQTLLPDVVESVLEMSSTIASGVYGRAKEPLARIREWSDADREPTTAEIAGVSVALYLASRSLGRVDGLQDLSLDVIRPSGEKVQGLDPGASPGAFFAFIFPGLVTFAVLFLAQSLALRLLRDRLAGLQRRVAVAPVSAGAISAGGLLYLLIGLAALLVVLGLIGTLLFGIPQRGPASLALLSLGLVVFAAGLQLAIVSASRQDGGAQAVSSIVILVLSLLGGTFVPVEAYPAALRGLAQSLPNGAVQKGLVDVLVHARGLADVAAHVVTVWTWGLGVLAVAFLLERRRLRA